VARYRKRERIEFGLVELSLLAAVVVIGGFLCRPARAETHRARPWVFGVWGGPGTELLVAPGGAYHRDLATNAAVKGIGLTMSPHDTLTDTFILQCGKLRFVVRSQAGGTAMDLLNDDGSVHSQLEQSWCLGGPICDGQPHGVWIFFGRGQFSGQGLAFLKYHQGEPFDYHDLTGQRNLTGLNMIRALQGLPGLTEADYTDDGMSAEDRYDPTLPSLVPSEP
jgi:hypothetical protein